jgi:hypothetical protein
MGEAVDVVGPGVVGRALLGFAIGGAAGVGAGAAAGVVSALLADCFAPPWKCLHATKSPRATSTAATTAKRIFLLPPLDSAETLAPPNVNVVAGEGELVESLWTASAGFSKRASAALEGLEGDAPEA